MSSNSSKGRAEKKVVIGKVVSVNVPRHELRIVPETSHPERFNKMQELCLRTKQGRTISMTLSSIRVAGSVIVARVETDDDEQIASARKASVVVLPEERFQVPDGEYYVDDLIGLIVKDQEGTVIGRLSDILETPANDIYQVIDDEGREILLPAIEDVILNIDLEGGKITADISNLI